ncbi:MAG TPA: cytochrome P460 family protein [Xanthomonadaceae bacterium]|nr:cytochrome P460 family protein [Xanthomonadaceae bacterium]
MPRRIVLLAILALAMVPVLAFSEPGEGAGPAYTADGKLLFPADYREWVYLSSGVDMSYNEKAKASKQPVFDNVFVDPAAYRAFRRTGTWPEGTQLVLEVRRSASEGAINHRGHFQAGDAVALEMHVKDSARFDGGWAFFGFEGSAPAAPIPATSACHACHRAHAAVDTTFVQFYPTLLPVAQAAGTLSPEYLAAEAAHPRKRR